MRTIGEIYGAQPDPSGEFTTLVERIRTIAKMFNAQYIKLLDKS